MAKLIQTMARLAFLAVLVPWFMLTLILFYLEKKSEDESEQL